MSDVSTDGLVELAAAKHVIAMADRKIEAMDIQRNDMARLIEALQRSNAEKDEALKTVVAQFESDFCIEGVIVDDPPKTFIIAYQAARKALEDKTL